MKIQNLFVRDIHRSINGVVKADQLDDSSVWQELDEFVVTREIHQHFRKFFSAYCEALNDTKNTDISGKIGVWVSGFFGSGKSHFIKVLSYLLHNQSHTSNGATRKAVEFFDDKITDAMLLGDVKRAVASDTDVILFNIDSKADHSTGRQAILGVFLKVLNEMQGFSGDHPHIAHMERFLDGKGKLQQFKDAFKNGTGSFWEDERDAYHFHRDTLVQALTETLRLSQESAEKWVDGAEGSYALTVENFCKWVKDYLDSKGPKHRLIFLVDEVGQFIGTDTHLMLSLQTITEELGTYCKGRAWVVVTSQEDIDAVLGEFKYSKANDFSKIQGRFRTRLSLSSANVDEVIQSRLLEKLPEVVDELKVAFEEKRDILRNQMTFKNCGMTLKPYADADDFVKNYPFAPYQFQLVQKVFDSIRRAGATGLHLSRGERSILDAFQSAAKLVALHDVGILVPLYRFYSSIESFLDTAVKRTIDQARDNNSLEHPFDIDLLQVLFLIRYVDEVKGNVDNLVTLCMDEMDADRLALRRKIEESLQRLEKETLISRNGDVYFFLTNEERDINREIKAMELTGGEEAKLLGEIIFNDVLKEQRKYRYPANKMDFGLNRVCDQYPIGNRTDGHLLVSVVTPLNDEYESYQSAKGILESNQEGGCVLIRLGNDATLGRELRAHVQTEKYIRHKNDGTAPETTKRIFKDIATDNQERRVRLVQLLGQMLAEADYFVAGQALKVKATAPMAALDEALQYLVLNTFTKMGYIRHVCPEPEREIQSVLRSNDIGQQTLALQTEEGNKQAIDDIRNYIDLSASAHRQVVLHDMIEKRYSVRPYGWPDNEVLILLARLMVLGEISLMMDGALVPLDKTFEAITNSAKRRKIIVQKRQMTDPKAIQNARALGKELFHEMGPDGEDALFSFLQNKFKGWFASLTSYKPLADTGNYPGKDEIDKALALVKKALSCDTSYAFIDQALSQKMDLMDAADAFNALEHFYEHQKPVWERLRKGAERFELNRMELERDAQAGPALRRLHQILNAPSPYGLIQEADGLLSTVNGVNTQLVTNRRDYALDKVNDLLATLAREGEAVYGNSPGLAECTKPLETLKRRIETQDSLAHITQAEAEILREFDAAQVCIDEEARKVAEKAVQKGTEQLPKPAVKKHRVIEPSKLTTKTYLETIEDVRAFVGALQNELEGAIANNERIQIR